MKQKKSNNRRHYSSQRRRCKTGGNWGKLFQTAVTPLVLLGLRNSISKKTKKKWNSYLHSTTKRVKQ